MQIVRNSVFVCIGELFFRANGLRAGLKMFQKMISEFSLATLKDGSLFTLGMDRHDCLIIVIAAALIFGVSVLQEKGIQIRESISEKNMILKFAFYYILVLSIVIFGAYGPGYVPLDPVYAKF